MQVQLLEKTHLNRSSDGGGPKSMEAKSTPFMEWVAEITERTMRNGDHGTVLLVDNEPSLLAVLCDVLENHGYRVLPADSAEAAIGLCQKQQRRIDFLVSDVRMPQMDGFELATAIRSVYPQVVVVLTSGTPIDFSKLDISIQFLEKPFAHEKLLAALSRSCPEADRSVESYTPS